MTMIAINIFRNEEVVRCIAAFVQRSLSNTKCHFGSRTNAFDTKTKKKKTSTDVAGLHFAFSLYIAGTVCSQIDLLQYGDRLVINEFISIRNFFELIIFSYRKNTQNHRHQFDKMMANGIVVCE